MNFRPAIFAVVVCLAGPTFGPRIMAQDAAATSMTAEELLKNANVEFSVAHWDKALAGYTKFIADFGQRPEAQPILARLRYPVAKCYLQLRKYAEALTAVDEALRTKPSPPVPEVQEMTFWKGLCQAQEEQHAAARASLEAFVGFFPPDAWKQPAYVAQFPSSRSVPDAQVLIGTTFLLEKKLPEAAAYFAKIKASLPAMQRGRVSVLELYALIGSGQIEAAVTANKTEFPRLSENVQSITFQTLTLELGSQLLERGEFRQAIGCLLRVGEAARLLEAQEKRLAELTARQTALEANPRSDPAQRQQIAQMVGNIRTELEQFKKIKNFDSSLRLRLATAFQAMQRYREAALILEGMLRTLPPDEIVEQASVSLVQCWGQIERWPKVVEAAAEFAQKFPQSKHRPLVAYLQGIAQQKNLQYSDAGASFAALLKDYPKSDFAPRALFMRGFTLLLADQPKDALPIFESFAAEYPKHELADSAAYWRGMALSLDKQFEPCRVAMDEYLANFPKGESRGLAVFRKAYAMQSLKNYPASIEELRKYLREYPSHESNSEALVLLGDALMATGEIEEGITAFKRIPPADSRFFEEGWFKIGKALKALERYADLRAHMEQFVREQPRSARIGEAVYWVGWVDRQEGKPEDARRIYWETIAKYGDDPAMRSVDDLFPAAGKLYKGDDERRQYVARLRDLREGADRANQKTLAMRALWALSRDLQKADPAYARTLLLEAVTRANVQTTNPLLLADFAEAFTAAGQAKEAEKMWRDLLKWNPRAPQKDRVLAALGQLELQRGNQQAALGYFDRFEKETIGSVLLSKVLLARAKLLEERGDLAGAQQSLDGLLANKASAGQEKSEALFRIAELQMRQDKPQLAIPYYQRIYVMYGRWRPWVAKAYLRSGEAFEKLQDPAAARKTYQEMLANDQLADQPERAQIEQRLQTLGGAPAKAL